MKAIKLSETARCGMEIYVVDPVFTDPDECDGIAVLLNAALEGNVLHMERLSTDAAGMGMIADRLNEASNSADSDGDLRVANALAALAGKVRRCA